MNDVTPPPPPTVALDAVQKTFRDGTKALLPLDLQVQHGEFVSLIGPSGCGKTTLLNMVAGLVPASTGSVRLWGRSVLRPGDAGRRLAYVFQEATLMPWASVEANVRLPLDLQRLPAEQAQARVDATLATVGLALFGRSLPEQLSGGMRMRVSLARALVTQPELLLMDEPFGALDEITRHELDDELLRLWQAQRLTVLFVTHSIAEAVALSTRVVVMAARPGRVVDDIRIDAPHPRGPEFRLSSTFAAYARTIHASLRLASADTPSENDGGG